jgi:branched-chain amino acid transport system permease protein
MSTISRHVETLPLRYVKIALYGVMLLVLFTIPLFANQFYVSLAYTVLLFVVLTSALNIHSGYTGYINFGFALFVGVGAYVAALGATFMELPVIGLWVLGGVAAAIVAAILSYPLLRVHGVYFSIAILAIAEGVRTSMSLPGISDWTNGGSGLSFFAEFGLFEHYYAIALLAVLVVATTHVISTRRIGLELLAIRENERVVESLGIEPDIRKSASFVLSGLFAGAAGAVNATYLLYVDPNTAFNLNYTIEPVAMAMIGGFGTVWGPVLGAIGIKLAEQILWSQFLELNQLFFGIVVVLGVLFVPAGIIRKLQHRGILSWSRKW